MNLDSSDDNTFVRHEPCPECTSSDAFAIYSDGGGYCFSCGYHRQGDGQSIPTTKSTRMISYQGDFSKVKSRKLTEETCRRYNVRVDSNPNVIRFPYYSGSKLVAYKERDTDKNFTWKGKNEDHQLFGQQLFGTKGKTIVVTEGELDAMAYYQVKKWPAVSVPNGAKAAKKALAHQLK